MPLELNYATPVRPSEPRWLAGSCFLGAASLLALAINVRDGEYWPAALMLLTVAIPLCITGALAGRVRDRGRGIVVLTGFILAAIAAHLFAYAFSPPGGWNPWSDDLSRRTVPGLVLYYAGPLLSWAMIAAVVLAPRARPLVVAGIVVVHVVVGVWLIRAAPTPRIDVFNFQQQAAQALLDGRSPYAMTFTDIYNTGQPGARAVYGADLVQAGRLDFGFPYPPLSLYLSTAGYALAGDHRYAQLAAMALAGLLIACMRTDWANLLFAAMFLFVPRGFFILGRGWTEPFVVVFLAATVYCALRHRKLLPIALGLLLASKQYLVLAVPLAALLVGRPFRWRPYLALVAKAGGVALLVTAPLALWNPPAFWHSLVTVQQHAPFREDALSYLVWFHHLTGLKPGVAPAFVAAGAAIGIALWRAERSPSGFAASVAMVYLVFIALNKQAFANYYYFVIGALWCAMGAMAPTEGSDE